MSFLIQNLSGENYDEVSEMIKLMLLNGCNINRPNWNNESETPFYLLLGKLQVIFDRQDLITFCIDNATVDFHSHKSDEIISMMNAQGLGSKIVVKSEPKVDMKLMKHQLDNNCESAFMKLFDAFKVNSGDFEFELTRLLREAIVRGLSRTVAFLMQNGANVGQPPPSEEKMSTGELACAFGHHEVLKVLLKDSNLKFKRDDTQSTLLHKILSAKKVYEKDRQKCFDFIISDHRCSLKIINSADKNNQTPLRLACVNGYNEILKELLRRGAFIGHDTIIDNIDKDLLEDFLDECVTCSSDISDKNCEVNVDFRFLMPPNVDQRVHSEMQTIFSIADNENLQDLVLHPVMKVYLELQWRQIFYLVYFNLFVHFGFLLFYGWFVVDTSRFADPKNVTYKNYEIRVFIENSGHYTIDDDDWIKDFSLDYFLYHWDFWICVLGISCIAVNEIIQCFVAFRKYFTKFSNYLDMSFVLISMLTLWCYFRGVENKKEVRSANILFIAAQCIQVITQVSALSISLHMTIFKRVCSTFLQTLSLYMILIIAFAMSFHSLYVDEKNEIRYLRKLYEMHYGKKFEEQPDERGRLNFSGLFSSIIITVRMMVSDFEYFAFSNDSNLYQEFLFLLFIILISIVLFNLLNALTISDTNLILKDAELVEAKKTVSILKSNEKIFLILQLSFANILPKMSLIKLTPNLNNVVTIRKPPVLYEVSIPVPDAEIKNYSNLIWKKFKRSQNQIKVSSKTIKKIREFIKLQHEKHEIDLKFKKVHKDLSKIIKFLEIPRN